MRKKLSIIFLIIGVIFIINTVLGRYLVVSGNIEYRESLASADIVDIVPSGWKIARYMLWAYSFKLGIYFMTLAMLLKTSIGDRKILLYALLGFLYIGFAYMPIGGPAILFGIGGIIITVCLIIILKKFPKEYESVSNISKKSIENRLVGYFFFGMATYNLCALLGVRCFALQPEKMIKYGLQEDAVSFGAHILIELTIGWVFILLSHLGNEKK